MTAAPPSRPFPRQRRQRPCVPCMDGARGRCLVEQWLLILRRQTLVLPILKLGHDCNLIPVSYRPIRSVVADACCRLPPRRPLPCRREFRRRAEKALDCPDAPRLAQPQAAAAAEKSERAVNAGQ